MAAYLLARQHLPLERASEAMADLFAAPMGEGTLAGLLPEAAGGLSEFMERVVDALHACPVVHADETSVRIGVGLGWVHTVSSRITPPGGARPPGDRRHRRHRGADQPHRHDRPRRAGHLRLAIIPCVPVVSGM
jgi:hypothetical protein